MDDKFKQKWQKNVKNFKGRNDNSNELRNLMSEREGLLNTKSSIFKSNSGFETSKKREVDIRQTENNMSFSESINHERDTARGLNYSMRERKNTQDELMPKFLPQNKRNSLRMKLNNTESSKIIIIFC